MEANYDIIIIGTGAGGGTLAHQLAKNSHKKILILERGDYLSREKQNWDPAAVFVKNRYKAKETWYDLNGTPFHPGIHYCVGGNTKVYGAALFRMRERDFEEMKHHDGVSPKWPISYQELAPYYDQAEQLYRVHGKRGEDPTEPPTDKPYPYQAVSNEPRIEELYEDLKKLGLNPFHLPIGVNLNEDSMHRSQCIRCDTCDGFPCLVNAKSDAQVIAIDPIVNLPNVTLMTNAKAEKLFTDASGTRVTSVSVAQNGNTFTVNGDCIVVSCGAVNSAVLLLKSANDTHPNGLANSSGMVGRHYMCHNNSAFVAISKRPNPTAFQKTIGINDFYFGEKDFPYPMGHIQMLGKSHAEMFQEEAPRFTPHIALDEMARHSLDFWMTTEDLPDPENRVTVDQKGTIKLTYRGNNTEAHQRLQEKLRWMLSHIGCETRLFPHYVYLGKKIPIAGTAHQCGTIRFGSNPKTSVLDVNCKAHELDNLYVVDGSFFVSSSSVNPGLTIMANAMRIADHLLQKYAEADSKSKI